MNHSRPWQNWYHCTGSTYGTWLPGESKGWRSRHHREHVEGDYKNPPRKDYGGFRAAAQANMQRDVVRLDSHEARQTAARAMIESFAKHAVEVKTLCIGKTHFHALLRFVPCLSIDADAAAYVAQWNEENAPVAVLGLNPQGRLVRLTQRGDRAISDPPRHYVGIAKKEASRALIAAGLVSNGGAWAKRGKVQPIESEKHFHSVCQYIPAHAREGAVVWDMKRGWVNP